MKKLLIIFFMLFTTPCMAQCVGEIKDVVQVEVGSGSQYRFITQYTCNGEVVDISGQPCNNCLQGNRVNGNATIEEAKATAEKELARHARNMNARYGNNAEKLKEEKIKIYAETKGVNIRGRNIEQIKSGLKNVLKKERSEMLKKKRDNISENLEGLKAATVGYKVTVDKYFENYMGKTIEVDTSEEISVSDIDIITP